MQNISEKIKHFIKENAVVETCLLLPHNYPKVDDFEMFQAGYRYNALTGENTTGNNKGDWQNNWYVICSDYFDNPFFVDFLEENKNFPVYFAFHGQGKWIPITVTDTIDDFLSILNIVSEFQQEYGQILGYLQKNVNVENEFWGEVENEMKYQEMKPKNSPLVDLPEDIKGKLIVIDIGANKLKVTQFIKTKFNLTPQEALMRCKAKEIEIESGYLAHLENCMEYLKSLGATVEFRAE